MLDAEGLKALGVVTVGQRLSILKALYYLKIAEDIPLDEDDYVPPCMWPAFFHHRYILTLAS